MYICDDVCAKVAVMKIAKELENNIRQQPAASSYNGVLLLFWWLCGIKCNNNIHMTMTAVAFCTHSLT